MVRSPAPTKASALTSDFLVNQTRTGNAGADAGRMLFEPSPPCGGGGLQTTDHRQQAAGL